MRKADRDMLNAVAVDLEQQVCDVCDGDGSICMRCERRAPACVCGEDREPNTCWECDGAGTVPAKEH